MKPTKYELFERDGAIVLRGYAPEAQNGWFNVEVVNRISWRTIPNLRKQAAHLAARWGVPFEDKLVGDKSGRGRSARRHQYAPAVRILLGVFPVQRLNACVNALTS